MAESCHSRSLSWLVKPCIPSDPNRHFCTPSPLRLVSQPTTSAAPTPVTTISDLPDDLLLECLARLPASSLPSLPLVSRRFNRLFIFNSDSFAFLRRRLGLLNHSLIALSVSLDLSVLSSAILRLHPSDSNSGMSPDLDRWTFPLSVTSDNFSHARAVSTGRFVYLIGRNAMLRSDVWTRSVTICAKPVFPRKKFAVAAIRDRVYVAGGSSRTSAVEEYDPETDSWRIVCDAPCRRYGCVGATTENGIFYIAGGLKLSGNQNTLDAHTCAGSIDAYHIASGTWIRTHSSSITTVPAGGCILGACGIGDMLYIMASHALEISFWRWNGEASTLSIRGGGTNGRWDKLKPPPVPGQVGTGLRFSCTAVGPNKVAAVVHVSAVRGRVAAGAVNGALLVYDIRSGEWTYGPYILPESRRTSCVSVEC
ncbi:Galactose oxidase/kelch repeat superfamily protein [Rhynchospora pubera]|uniref:Galactose oxidase/kelch repeat superfamily protein n=1 Tax=Rhynchospora pubera TaxID=906938 RepID=A0AAV8BZG5_9POAL|nr:Galactose oxidase/kelch repeat superfamily protein [Rhynchospora pubera]KAJ4758345.1 Galactose oxidase/kelch repeat superfamily protein [Rhynchospora pubera]